MQTGQVWQDGEIYLKQSFYLKEGRPETGYVPVYFFRIHRLSDDIEVGHCDLRVGLNDRIMIAGNIGYGIWEKHRGHHYAAKACKILFAIAKELGMTELLITCDPTNLASSRTCQLAGCQLLAIVDVPPESIDYDMGFRQKCQYHIAL